MGEKKKTTQKNIIFHYNLNIAATNPPEYIKEMSDSLEKKNGKKKNKNHGKFC